MSKETPERRLEGRVAAILNARELVINIGAEDGVKPGQKFAVLAATPLEIRDPESESVLDTIDREKVRVEAHEVRLKITVCRTYRMKGGFGGMLGASHIIADMMGSPAVLETLSVKDSNVPPPLPEEESYVKINDRVISVEE